MSFLEDMLNLKHKDKTISDFFVLFYRFNQQHKFNLDSFLENENLRYMFLSKFITYYTGSLSW